MVANVNPLFMYIYGDQWFQLNISETEWSGTSILTITSVLKKVLMVCLFVDSSGTPVGQLS